MSRGEKRLPLSRSEEVYILPANLIEARAKIQRTISCSSDCQTGTARVIAFTVATVAEVKGR